MQAHEIPPRRKPSITSQAALAAGILAVFLLLHVLAGAILQRTATTDGAQAKPASTLQPYD
ncbi:hypothetical protein S58_29650 [Bradyrhizobium oligotrophicum S58]|uniref:Uncharacterized protein n=1 Tax=Bradyrhizobium oligotrophicum S58 TaxID=1245469 RepID=M4Z7A0_9BRAD|nr:hypothetical protein [Bradyrhizobium oligotrophicum]BAM88966.1 hypothetical protein S58_29650 [Bradyrhizobium oligotrophicum S58]